MPRRRAVRRRRRTRRSGGGTGDKKPQFLNVYQGVLATANTWYSTLGEIPLLNILSGGTKVVEILKVQISKLSVTAPMNYAIGSRNLNSILFSAYSVASAQLDRAFMVTGTIAAAECYREIDLTDEAGNGQLYPAQQFYVNLGAATTGDAVKVSFLYRIKNATMQEYIGIINQYVVTNS